MPDPNRPERPPRPEHVERAQQAFRAERLGRDQTQSQCDAVFRQMEATREALAELHNERERLGMSFEDIQERSGLTGEEIEGLKANRPLNLLTLRSYASALGMRLELSVSRVVG